MKGLTIYVGGLWVVYIVGMMFIINNWNVHNSWSADYHAGSIVVIFASTVAIFAYSEILRVMTRKPGPTKQPTESARG